MQALIELDSDKNFLINLKRSNGMQLSTLKMPLGLFDQLMVKAEISNNRMIPTVFNIIEDEDDFYNTLALRNLDTIKTTLISNLDGIYFEIANEDLKAGIIYGPIRFKMFAKIMDINWPVEIDLPIYIEKQEELFDEKDAQQKFKKLTPDEQKKLLADLEEQEKLGEI